MIKNEERILKRCLEAAEKVVDCFCICDTGSTDKTVEVAKEFLSTRTGCITVEPWKNFGHNRTVSFKNAQAFIHNELKWDLKETYGLLLDADMIFVPGKLREHPLGAIGYRFIQIAGNLEYYNTRLVRMDYPWKCVSVTHEYWDGPTENMEKDICFIDDRNDGGCKHDKYERDQRLLEQSE
jgi:glycosyltransferase involved in cell wall biosynthesis